MEGRVTFIRPPCWRKFRRIRRPLVKKSSARSRYFSRRKDESAAIAIANKSDFGFGANVWTNDRGAGVVRRANWRAMVFVNGMVASDPRLPSAG